MPIVSTGDGLSLGVSLVLLEIPDDPWVKQAIVAALEDVSFEENWRAVGSNSPDLSARVLSLILQTILFDYEPPPMTAIGLMSEWPTDTPPTGWLLCNGQSLLRDDYPALFAVIGTTFGEPDGTHFALPDKRDRSSMMPGFEVVTALGQQAGEMEVSLIIDEMPGHDHDYADPGHVHALTDPGHVHTLTDPGHNHQQQIGALPQYTPTGGSGRTAAGVLATVSTTRVVTDSQTTGASVASGTTGASVASHSTDITFNQQGGNIPHNNLHPVLGVNSIIYAGV